MALYFLVSTVVSIGAVSVLFHAFLYSGRDKPLALLIVVRRLSVDKGQVLRSGMLDTPFYKFHPLNL